MEWNPGAQRLFGYTPEEAKGKNLDDLVAPGESEAAAQAHAFSSFVLKQHAVPYTEAIRYRQDGTPVEVILSGAPIIENGRTVGAVASYKDISAQKEAQREVRKLLEEKQLLLEEAHHRIKNDMFLIRSMLSLQATRTEAAAARAALEEAGRRVAIIGEMYSGLYQKGGFQWVPLAAALERTVSQFKGPREGLEISISAEEGELGARPAVAIGIVVNELITNAIKHASGGANAEALQISVEAHRVSEQTLRLRVRDNGTGFSKGALTGAERGLGLEIVSSMAEQYDGTLSLQNDEGGVVEVTMDVAWRSESS